MFEDFGIDDIEILIEAVDSWKSRGFAGEMMVDMLGSMLAKDEESKKKIQEEREKEKNKREEKKRKDSEKADILKAKLILLKQRLYSSALKI